MLPQDILVLRVNGEHYMSYFMGTITYSINSEWEQARKPNPSRYKKETLHLVCEIIKPRRLIASIDLTI
jgi:hypothetical protein